MQTLPMPPAAIIVSAAGYSYHMNMDDKIRIGVSACLLGRKVRYDAGHKLDRFLTDTLGQYVEWVPVCPEVESGLPVPREAMRLVAYPEGLRLVAKHTGIDHTERMLSWVDKKLKQLERMDLCGFVFKSKSPSSGMTGVKIYTPSGMPNRKGSGMFAGIFMRRFPLVPVEDEERLHDPALRENFIERLFVLKRWQELRRKGLRINKIIEFHIDHKLLILAHSPKHYQMLGRLVAQIKQHKPDQFALEYITTMMEGLRLIATVKKNTNVLRHILGYLKKQLPVDERQEVLEIIDHYHKGQLPLIVPIVLINHFARKYDVPYLTRQYYLHPHPLELMLRNHA
ncbi:MAG: DUF1722 domain-containing protein [Nitrospirota bacterium]